MADRYWVGGTGTWDTTSTTNWSASSGGAGGASVPGIVDSVFFDQAGAYTVTMTGALACLDITVSAGTVTFATGTTPTLNVRGSMTLLAGTVWNSTGTITLNGTAVNRTITTNGVTLNGSVTFNVVGGDWTLGSNLTLAATRTTTLSAGTLSLSTFTLATGFFSSSGTSTRSIAFGTGNITVNGSGGTLWTTAATTGLTTTGTQVVNVSYSGAVATTISPGSLNEANSISFNFTAGTYALTMTSGSWRNLNFTGFAGTVGNTTQTIYGNVDLGSTATFTAGPNAWTFAATSTGKTITSNGKSFPGPVTFAGNGGSWLLQDNMTVPVARTTTLTNGTINLQSFTLTTGFFSSNVSSTRSIAFGTGNITVNGAGGTLWATDTIGGLTTTGTQLVNVSYAGAVATSILSGSLSEANSISFSFTAGTYTLTLNAGTKRSLNFTGFAGTVGNTVQTIYGDLTLVSAMTLAAGINAWTFAGTSTGKTITSNGETMDFPVTFNGTGSWLLQDAMTVGATQTTTLTNGTLDLQSYTLSTGLFNSSGSATRTIAFGTGNITVTATGGTVWTTATTTALTTTGTQVVNVTNNGATATTVSSGSLNEANSISFNFTGGGGTYALTLSAGTKRNLSFGGNTVFQGTIDNTAQTIYGDLTINSLMTFTAGLTAWTFAATSGSKNITSNGGTLQFPATFNGAGGTWVLQDAFTVASNRTVTHTNGTIDLNGKTFTAGNSYTTAAGTKNLTFNGGTLVCSANGAAAFSNAAPTGFTTTAGTGTGTITMTGMGAKSFAGGGSTFNCTLNQGGAGALTVEGSNTINNFTNTVRPATVFFQAGTTNTFNNFNLNGTPGNLITISGVTGTLSKASGTVSCDYLSISNSNATGGASWYAGANSTNSGGNTGWIFTAPPTPGGNTGAFFSIL